MKLDNYKEVIESQLFEIGPVVAFIWENKENWPVFCVSKNIEKIYGHRVNDLLSSKLQYASLIHKDDLNNVFSEVMEASTSGKTSFEHKPYRIITDESAYKWVQDTTVIIRENGMITHYIGYLNDITTLKELEEKTLEQNQILQKHKALFNSYKLVMDESSIVSKADLDGNITYINDKFCEISGYTREELIGSSHSIIKSFNTSKSVIKDLWETITNKKVWNGILLNRGKKGNYWVEMSVLPILDENDTIVEYIAVRHDITKMIVQQQKLDDLANTDTLTGYGNRYKLNNDIKKSLNPGLAILNIDHFSQINDFYGHIQGDIIIQKLGQLLAKMIEKESCQVYHLQGDEYVLFNPKIANEIFIEKIAKIALDINNTSIKILDEDIHLHITTAISFETEEKLLTTADMALKVAKRENKDLMIYNKSISLNDEYKNNIKWTQIIKEAIDEERIIPVFQPIINNKTEIWEKYESLVRIKDRDGRLITPYFFLEISKKTKYYNSITKIILEKSFETFKDRDVEFSVNLTIQDILDEDINIYIFEMLQKYNIGQKVVFEIVESESIENFEEITLFIDQVKQYGSKIAIDDFGTGYSNFEYLMKLKADYIKIDGSLIKYIDNNQDAQLVVSTIVDFAKKMKIKTIAEFVENESIYNKVKELGIDYTQGYYFSKPLASI